MDARCLSESEMSKVKGIKYKVKGGEIDFPPFTFYFIPFTSSFALLCVTRYTPVNTSKAAIGLSQLNTSCPIRIAIMEAMIGCKLLYILAVVGRIRFKAIGTRK